MDEESQQSQTNTMSTNSQNRLNQLRQYTSTLKYNQQPFYFYIYAITITFLYVITWPHNPSSLFMSILIHYPSKLWQNLTILKFLTTLYITDDFQELLFSLITFWYMCNLLDSNKGTAASVLDLNIKSNFFSL